MHIYMHSTHTYYNQKRKKQSTKCKRDTEFKLSNFGLVEGDNTLDQPDSSAGEAVRYAVGLKSESHHT